MAFRVFLAPPLHREGMLGGATADLPVETVSVTGKVRNERKGPSSASTP
ncbi:hypothetical protein [Nonomuraea jiangxiensis]|nr:hypothetical protein [Nonomuraea jiangxiensis]